jgi:hypothetical protein
LEGHVENALIDALANIAVIGPSINMRISAKSPLDYVTRYRIIPEKLEQQFIKSDFTAVPFAELETWLHQGAERLATAANSDLASLREGI